jgi:hypothetical protein
MRLIASTLLLLAAPPAFAASVDDRTAVSIATPQELIVDKSLPPAAVAALLKPVEAFYGFWNNASRRLLDRSISRHFVDRALPWAGRRVQQGR